MAKYIYFYPKNYIQKEKPNNEVLWKINFNIISDDKLDLKIYVYDLVTDTLNDSFPLAYLEKSMNEMGMQKIYDFPYKKEYLFSDPKGMSFTATLTALDLDGFVNEIKLKKKFAEILLTDMKLSLEGDLHPERFMRKMSTCIDLSDSKYKLYERNFDDLLELENLCDTCLQYETNIEWKIINEVVK